MASQVRREGDIVGSEQKTRGMPRQGGIRRQLVSSLWCCEITQSTIQIVEAYVIIDSINTKGHQTFASIWMPIRRGGEGGEVEGLEQRLHVSEP
jgi:hypothetical protein